MPAPKTIRLFGTVDDSIVDGPGLRFSVFVQGCSHHCPGCHNEKSWPADAGEEVSIESLVARILENKLDGGVTLSGGDPFEQPQACAEVARRVKQAGRNVWVYTGYTYEDLLAQIALLEGGAASIVGGESDGLAVAGESSAASAVIEGTFVQKLRSIHSSSLDDDDEFAASVAKVEADVAIGGSFTQKLRNPRFAPADSGDANTSAMPAQPLSAEERERLEGVRDLLEYADVLVDGPFIQAKRSLSLKYCGSSNQRLIDMEKTRRAGHVVLWKTFDEYPVKPPSW